jgi:hypothetical protein
MTWIGIQDGATFIPFVFALAGISFIVIVVLILVVLQKIIHQFETFSLRGFSLTSRWVLGGILGLVMLEYLVLCLLLPERGYDALHVYIPESLYLAQTGQLPAVDFLSLRPIVKEPLVSFLQ